MLTGIFQPQPAQQLNTLSRLDRFLAALGVRAVEKNLVALLFGNMFMAGLAIGIIRVCAFTLFLEHFAAQQLALVGILLAVTGTLVTLTLERVTRGFSAQGYIYTILGTILIGVLIIRLLLATTSSTVLIFTLPLFFEVVYMLFSLQFMALLTRLLNVRETKRLSGLAHSGEFLAEMVGGLSIAILLNFMDVPDLLMVAAVAVIGVFAIVQFTIIKFRKELTASSELDSSEEHSGRMIGMMRIPYVQMIAFCYAGYVFAYLFLDVAFYKYAAIQFPVDRDLAKFIGQFFGLAGFVTMFAMVLFFAPFLRKFGILFGIITFPIAIAIGAASVSTMEFQSADAALIFIVIVATNGMRFVLESSIWRPSYRILFQVLPDRQRRMGTALIDGIVDPIAGGLAGLCLFCMSEFLGWEPKQFLVILTIFMLVWIGVGFFIRRQYLANLVSGMQKRKLGEFSISQLDNDSLQIIMAGLNSDYPSEIFYCLDTLEEMGHPDLTDHIKHIITNAHDEVRMDILKRIERLRLFNLIDNVQDRIFQDDNSEVVGQALRTYAALNPQEAMEHLMPYLNEDNLAKRKGALVGVLSYDPANNEAQTYLLRTLRSKDVEERLFATEVLGEIGSSSFSGFLLELLGDENTKVQDSAIIAAGQMDDTRLINLLVGKLSNPNLRGRAGQALRRYGDRALYDLDLGFASPSADRQVRIKIIDIIQNVGTEKATEALLKYINIDLPELKHQIYVSLASVNYQALPDDRYRFTSNLDQEASTVTWILAAIRDLQGEPDYERILSAMVYELEIHRDNLLLLMSFVFDSAVLLDTRANIDSKIADIRVFALEVLDNVLTAEVKAIVIPLLDDISTAEQLDLLSIRYPQQALATADRFDDIISKHFADAFYWTRATLLHQIGERKLQHQMHVVRDCLDDAEPIVRETALWSLVQLNPPDMRRTLSAHAEDASEDVRRIVLELLSQEPESV